ncbi:MaoC family dehydratase [Okibacterium endophyticum]
MSVQQTETQIAVTNWEDAPKLAGQEFCGSWFSVEEDKLALFDEAIYVKKNPNGVNIGLYPPGLIEGFHLLGLLDHLVNEVCYIDEPRWSGWNYGFDRVRFVSMVTLSDRIRVRGTVQSIEQRGDNLLVLFHCTLEVEGRAKPGMIAEWRVMWTLLDEETAS